VHYHWSRLVGLDPVPHHGADPPPELQDRVAKRTRVAVPFGEMELKNKSLLNHLLQSQQFTREQNRIVMTNLRPFLFCTV
jgi:hypothetical protein